MTWDAAKCASNIALSGEGWIATATTGGNGHVRGVLGQSQGKRYFEIALGTKETRYGAFGIVRDGASQTSIVGTGLRGYGLYENGSFRPNLVHNYVSRPNFGDAYFAPDRVGVAVDFDAAEIRFYKNGGIQAFSDQVELAFSGITAGEIFYPAYSPCVVGYSASLDIHPAWLPDGYSAWGDVSAPEGELTLPVVLRTGPVGSRSIPLVMRTGGVGSFVLPARVSVVPAGGMSGASINPAPAPGYGPYLGSVWRPVVTLDAVDITDQVVGDISVEAEEGAARVADFSVRLAPGQALTLPAWVGRVVTIDFAAMAPDGIAMYPIRLFTGVVDTPDIDAGSRVISLTCTDDLQGVCDAMTDAQIDALIPAGRWSEHVFDPATSHGWQRVQDVVSTVAGSVDLDPYRLPRFSPWHKVAVDFEYTADDVEDDSCAVSFAGRSGLVNQVKIEFTYRYQRLNVVHNTVSYNVLTASGMSFYDYVRNEKQLLPKSGVTGAMSGAGGNPTSIGYDEAPGDSWIDGPGPDDGFAWIKNDAVCLGWTGWVHTPYSYTIDERHLITVAAPLAIAQVGIKSRATSSSVEGVSQGSDTWEDRVYNSHSTGGTSPVPVNTIGADGASQDATTTPGTSREAANAAMMVLIDMAKVQIQASHRQSSVTFVALLNPMLDLDKQVAVTAETVAATGKVSAVRHLMSPATGRAVSEITLAISALSGTGVTHPETPTIAPVEPVKPTAPITMSASVSFHHEKGSDGAVSISLPAVPPEAVQNRVIDIVSSYDAGLVENLFTVTT